MGPAEIYTMAERLAAYEDTGLTPEEIKDALPEDVIIKLAAQALRTEQGRLRELVEADELVREMEWRSDKYINYTATREKACKGCTSRDGTEGCYSMEPCEHLIAEIIRAPAADVAPVVHGRWVPLQSMATEYACSVCGRDYTWGELEEAPYCPNCGARMDRNTE